jgi:hypothetical protein
MTGVCTQTWVFEPLAAVANLVLDLEGADPLPDVSLCPAGRPAGRELRVAFRVSVAIALVKASVLASIYFDPERCTFVFLLRFFSMDQYAFLPCQFLALSLASLSFVVGRTSNSWSIVLPLWHLFSHSW